MDRLQAKDVWRFASMVYGVLSVMTSGVVQMPKLLVHSLATQELVSET